MSIQKEALSIYNMMPVGTKELVANQMGGTKWYLKNRISNIRTPKHTLIQLVRACSEISEKHKEKTISHNDEVQKDSMNFISKHSN